MKTKHAFILLMSFTVLYWVALLAFWISTPQTLRYYSYKISKAIPGYTDSPKRVLLVGVGRSGTTLTSKLIAHHSYQTIYWFEPAIILQNKTTPENHDDYAKQLTGSIFSCATFPMMKLLSKWHSTFDPTLDRYGRCLGNSPGDETECAADYRETCARSKLIVVKYIRLNMTTIQALMQEDPSVKVIYLVRHPGRVAFSQKITFGANSAAEVCSRVSYDLTIIQELPEELRSRLLIVKHEDVLTQPDETRRRMFTHIGLSDTEEAESFHMESLNCTGHDIQDKTKYTCGRGYDMFEDRAAFKDHRDFVDDLLKHPHCRKIVAMMRYSDSKLNPGS